MDDIPWTGAVRYLRPGAARNPLRRVDSAPCPLTTPVRRQQATALFDELDAIGAAAPARRLVRPRRPHPDRRGRPHRHLGAQGGRRPRPAARSRWSTCGPSWPAPTAPSAGWPSPWTRPPSYFGAYLPDEGVGRAVRRRRPDAGRPVRPQRHRRRGRRRLGRRRQLPVRLGPHGREPGRAAAFFSHAGRRQRRRLPLRRPPRSTRPRSRATGTCSGSRARSRSTTRSRACASPTATPSTSSPRSAHRGSAMHHLGVLPLTAVGHAAWALGVTRRVLDELQAAAGRTRMGAPSSIADSDHGLITIARLESQVRRRPGVGPRGLRAGRGRVRRVRATSSPSRPPTWSARRACTSTRPASTSPRRPTASPAPSPCATARLQRAFRDLHAGGQHFFASNAASIDWAKTLLEQGN